jgi:hypothetical protein
MDLTVDRLAKDLKLSKRELLDYIVKMDAQYNLNLSNYYELNRYHYDFIRASLDTRYLLECLKSVKRRGSKPGEMCDRTKVRGYSELFDHLMGFDLDEFSTADIRASLPDNLSHCSQQMIATAMRNLGYTNKTVVLDNQKQGRRWFKDAKPASFM